MDWMLMPLRRYAEFGGRSRRKEYWMFFLFTVIVSAILGVLDTLLGLKLGPSTSFRSNGVLGSVFSLVTLVPSIAVGVRRLHDTDRSGWWLLMPVVVIAVAVVLAGVAFAGSGGGAGFAGLGFGLMAALLVAGLSGIVLLVFFCLDGTRGPNRFGADPKDANLSDVFA